LLGFRLQDRRFNTRFIQGAGMAEQRSETVVEDLLYPESPRWFDNALWCTDVSGHRLVRWVPGGVSETVADLTELAPAAYAGQRPKLGPSGLDFLPDGTALLAMMSESGPLRTRVLAYAEGRVETYADLAPMVSGRLNDMVVAVDGGVYVGALDASAIVYIAPSRAVSIALSDVALPNGMAISPGGTQLYYVAGGTYVYAVDIVSPGRLGTPRLWADLTIEAAVRRRMVNGTPTGPVMWSDLDALSGADGIALDAEGALWVGGVSTEKFIRITEGGFVTDVIRTPGRHAVACHLGGADRRTLFLVTVALKPGSVRTGAAGSPALVHQLYAGETTGYVETLSVEVPGVGRP
jgi:sugar lactone lactonase YvrE